ncbi:TetR/AcrR family transcriptional regulator [Pseudonocardia broussonetiae]|uniref:TetR/AcrR family transcriptional regulator n=1 Tax=Pseudonocardia broussonetiae TaxID=2736640 RepID=A0A6M6JN04_9PSEU|nr:TetR/AcrR family transcriptional regulator [Pseudonocardia broussonetiae]QJY48002.1 TetR/AcrR family transcriptional regulator [Pseudonocardia broussonetiae]
MTSSASGHPSGVAYGEGKLALLDAAIAVVADGGLRKLTWRAVAQRAGVTHGLVAHHFGSRDALITAALELAVQRSIDASRLVPGSDRLEDFAANLVDMAVTDADAQAFQYELILEARRNPELRPHVRSLLETYRRNARTALVELGLPDDQPLADLVYAALDGLVFGVYSEDDPARAHAALGRLRELLGLLARQGWTPDSR